VGGQVTVRSRAVDDSGNLEGRDGGGSPGGVVPPVTPPTGATPPPAGGPGAPTTDQLAPRVRVRPRRVRASRRGLVALRVSCPPGEAICRVDLRLLRAGTTVARKKLELRGGETRRVSLRLTQGAQRSLLRMGSLRVVALAAARDLAANRGTSRTRIRVLAPRRT
jgi:hypothetical protein